VFQTNPPSTPELKQATEHEFFSVSEETLNHHHNFTDCNTVFINVKDTLNVL
jgi:hypothetical protein